MPASRAVDVVAMVGATATGKSELAVAMALALRGEVVNADSMQLYRGMDVGTAKITPSRRRGIPHHLLDILDVTEPATVADYQGRARAVVGSCRTRGVLPILVGGSALYVRAVLDRFDFPGTDPDLRARLEAEAEQSGTPTLHQRLAAVDPLAATAISPTDSRRVVRALEVIELTGRPYTATLPEHAYAYPHAVQIGLGIPKPDLDARIARRVEAMWAGGLVAEVEALQAAGLRSGRTASRALGYAQVLRFLARECSEQQAKDDTVRATRRFARRQDTWFRRDPRVRWLPHDDPELLGKAVALARGDRCR